MGPLHSPEMAGLSLTTTLASECWIAWQADTASTGAGRARILEQGTLRASRLRWPMATRIRSVTRRSPIAVPRAAIGRCEARVVWRNSL
jgi:hypothetical protein